MDTFFTLPAIALIALTLPGTLLLAVLTLAGCLPARPIPSRQRSGHIAFIVPAHDEAAGIAATVRSLRDEAARDGNAEVVVIADNCSDATAEIARNGGARVLERQSLEQRGKGYALAFAFERVSAEAYVIVDADSAVSPGFLDEVRAAWEAGAAAGQARYLPRNADDSPRSRLMRLALLGFNVLRPRGRERLGLSAGILGNGFFLTRATLQAVPYRAGSVVEDLEYHLDLVSSGRRVWFLDEADVVGDMPTAAGAAQTQRTRWEGGRFRMIRTRLAGLCAAVLRGRLALLEPALELLLLPLAYHVMLLLALLALPVAAGRLLALAGLAVVALHVLAAIARVGNRHDLATLALVPRYLAWKLLLLPASLAASSARMAWVRTARSATEIPSSSSHPTTGRSA